MLLHPDIIQDIAEQLNWTHCTAANRVFGWSLLVPVAISVLHIPWLSLLLQKLQEGLSGTPRRLECASLAFRTLGRSKETLWAVTSKSRAMILSITVYMLEIIVTSSHLLYGPRSLVVVDTLSYDGWWRQTMPPRTAWYKLLTTIQSGGSRSAASQRHTDH